MDELTQYGIKKNLILWIAYVRIGQITLEQTVERIEPFFRDIQQALDFDEIIEVLPIISDVIAMLNHFGGINAPFDLFPKAESSHDYVATIRFAPLT